MRSRRALLSTVIGLSLVAACGSDEESTTASGTVGAASGATSGGGGMGGEIASGPGGAGGEGAQKPQPCIDMVDTALAFLDALENDEHALATADFGSDAHTKFEFLPPLSAPRDGLSIKDMDEEERELLTAFLQAAFSASGHAKVEAIRALESVLAMQEEGVPVSDNRDPDNYFIQIYGTPVVEGELPWAFRFEGHHLSVQGGVIDCELFSATPAFWGASPDITPLSTEVTAAEALWNDLDAGQRAMAQATVTTAAIEAKTAKIEPLQAEGLRAGDMTAAQVDLLNQIIDAYLGNMNAVVATQRRSAIEAAGFDDVSFAYDGGDYRVLGPTFVIELVFAGATHIHSVWRDYDGDFGDDLIAEHMARSH